MENLPWKQIRDLQIFYLYLCGERGRESASPGFPVNNKYFVQIMHSTMAANHITVGHTIHIIYSRCNASFTSLSSTAADANTMIDN